MKYKEFRVNSFSGGGFCPSCHRVIKFQFSAQSIRARNGICLNCSNCKLGKIKLLPSFELLNKWDEEDKPKRIEEAKKLIESQSYLNDEEKQQIVKKLLLGQISPEEIVETCKESEVKVENESETNKS